MRKTAPKAVIGLIAVVIGAFLPNLAGAQISGLQPLSSPNIPVLAPSASANPGAALTAPGGGIGAPAQPVPQHSPLQLPSGPMTQPAVPMVPTGQVALYLSARFGTNLPPINGALHWRIYHETPEPTGMFRLVREEKLTAPALVLPPGGYIVHVALGQAQVAKRVELRSETVREVFDIPAGGIRAEGRVGDIRIPAGQISFDVYKGSQFEPGDKRPLTQGLMTGEVVLVPEGTYTIVSNYGDGNAVVRSDIRVQAAKLTDVTVTHRAAVITLKLVTEKGGEAIANTAWSVLTPGGDVIKESIGAFPRVILAEGDYRVIARNEGKVFERDLKVITGVDSEIAVVAR